MHFWSSDNKDIESLTVHKLDDITLATNLDLFPEGQQRLILKYQEICCNNN